MPRNLRLFLAFTLGCFVALVGVGMNMNSNTSEVAYSASDGDGLYDEEGGYPELEQVTISNYDAVYDTNGDLEQVTIYDGTRLQGIHPAYDKHSDVNDGSYTGNEAGVNGYLTISDAGMIWRPYENTYGIEPGSSTRGVPVYPLRE